MKIFIIDRHTFIYGQSCHNIVSAFTSERSAQAHLNYIKTKYEQLSEWQMVNPELNNLHAINRSSSKYIRWQIITKTLK